MPPTSYLIFPTRTANPLPEKIKREPIPPYENKSTEQERETNPRDSLLSRNQNSHFSCREIVLVLSLSPYLQCRRIQNQTMDPPRTPSVTPRNPNVSI